MVVLQQVNGVRRKGDLSRIAFENVVQQAINGDKESLLALCQAISTGVLVKTSLMLRNNMDAEDAAQEVMLRVCSKIHTLNEPKAFWVWLDRIIVGEINRFMEKNYMHKILDIEDYLNSFLDDNEDNLPSEYTRKIEESKLVMDVVKTLSEQQRKAVMLYYFGELNQKEAAEVMGVSRERVKQCLATARKKIRIELEKQDAELENQRSAASGVAAISISNLLMRVFRQETTNLTFENPIWIQETLIKCQTLIDGAINVIPSLLRLFA